MQDEISTANSPTQLLLEQHGLGGLMASAASCRNNNSPAAAAALPPPTSQGKAAAKEPSPRTNTAVINRREYASLHAKLLSSLEMSTSREKAS